MLGTRGSVTLYLPGEHQRYGVEHWEAQWFHFFPSASLLDQLRHASITTGFTFPVPLDEHMLQAFTASTPHP